MHIEFQFPGLADIQSGTILVGKNLQHKNISAPTTFPQWTFIIVVFA